MDGDGVVAVVRGSNDAGLLVTLLPNAYFRGDVQKFNINNDSIYARVTQSSAQTNTEIPQNIRRYNVTYQVENYYKPSVNYILPHQMNKRTYIKNMRAHLKLKRQQTYRQKRYACNKTVDTNQEINYNLDSFGNRSLSSVEATSSSQKELTKYMYDYLKNESLVPKVDVRYFTEIKKALRSGLRKITDNNSPCPVKGSRCHYHKRHDNCSKHSLSDSASYKTKVLKKAVSSNISRSKCFCHQPSTCECDSTKETIDTKLICTKYLNESNGKSKPKSKLKANIYDIYAPGDFTDSIHQKAFDVISKWVKDIPKQPNFDENYKAKQDVVIKKLSETIKNMFHTEDFVKKARPEIMKCLNSLLILRPDDATDEARFKEGLINDLISRFVELAETDFVECISSDIRKIAVETNTNGGDIQSQINYFMNELIPIALKRPINNETYKEILKAKLTECLKKYKLLDETSDSENINDLGERFADRLCHMYLYKSPNNDGEINQYNDDERKILDWLKDTPEFSTIDINECFEIINSLIHKYSNYKTEDHNIETHMKLEDDIEKCLDFIANTFQISLSKGKKEELIKQLRMLLFGVDKNIKDEDNTSLGTIMEWLSTIPGLSAQNIIKNEEEVKNYAKLMKEVQTHMDNKLPNVKKVISTRLQNFLGKNNLRLDPKIYNNLINKLINKVNNMSSSASVVIKPRKRWDDLDSRPKYSDIKNIVDACFSNFGANLKEVTKRKIIEDILKNTTDQNILWDKVLKNIMTIMLKETSLGQNAIKKISDEIIRRVRSLFSRNKLSGRNHINSQLHKFTNGGNHQEETLLVNLNLNNQSKDRSKKNYQNIQILQSEKEANTPHTSRGGLKEESIQQVGQISHNTTSANDTSDFAESKASRQFLGPNNVTNFSNTKDNDDEMISVKEYYSGSSSILESMKTLYNNILDEKKENLKDFKGKYQYNISKEDFSKQTEQENLLFDDNFTTSTPIDSQKDVSVSNKALSTENRKIDKKYVVKQKSSGYSQYINDARSAIYNWLILFDINISSLEKNYLTETILSDYFERQKYLQLSGIKTKVNEEIEQLKYQIYRQMYKLTNSETLQEVMVKVSDLYENLKNLTSSKTLKEEQILDAKLKTSRTENLHYLTRKIGLWLNSISSQFHLLNNNNYEENMIQDLSKSLYLLRKEGNYKTHGKNVITSWIPKVLSVSDKSELNDLTENLMMYLEHDSLRDTQIPMHDISDFFIENLRGVILDWSRKVRPFPRHLMSNLPLLENFASLLANDLKRVFENNSNVWSNEFENLLIEEIIKNFKNILNYDEKDSTFYEKLAKNILTYIKQLRLFHNISDRLTMNTIHGNNFIDEFKCSTKIKQAIFIWSKDLTLETGKSYEDIKESIQCFVEKLLTYIRDDFSSVENRLKDDTLQLLKIIPLKIHQERNNVLQGYIRSLINTIKRNINLHNSIELSKEIDEKIDSSVNVRNVNEHIYNIIKNWCDILPFHVEDSTDSKEKIKGIRQNLASQIIQFIHNLNSNDDIPKRNVYELLRDNIKEQLKTLCTTPDLEKCMDLLIDVLIVRLKDAKCLNVKDSIWSTYNFLLHETINKTLSLIDNPSGDIEISLDLLKEKLANAFIELHHPNEDVNILSKYKDKLYNMISKFCNEFLNQSLIAPRDYEKVKEDLDKALRNVSVPKLSISKEFLGKINENIILKRHISIQCDINFPSTTLSAKDIELLNSIRSRSRSAPLPRSTAGQRSIKIVHKDVCISPMPVDSDTQTEIQLGKNNTDGIAQTSNYSLKERVNLRNDVTTPQISPQVVIKEYYWDTGSNQSLHMSVLSEISQKIDRAPSVLAQTEDFIKNNVISNEQSKTTERDANKNKKETAYIQTDIPTKHIKNTSQQTSTTLEPITSPFKSHLEVNEDEIDNFINDEDKSIQIDPKSKRAVIPSDVIPSRHKLNLENNGDLHIKNNKNQKHLNDDISKMKSENREIENYQDTFSAQNCNCKDYIFSKCRNRKSVCGNKSNLRHCAKGYGCFCPHPSNLFFKRDF